jgi:hypothetical protein
VDVRVGADACHTSGDAVAMGSGLIPGLPPQLAAMSGILRRVNLKKDQSNTHVLRRTDARLLSFLPKTTTRDMSLFCPIKGGGGRDLCSTDPRRYDPLLVRDQAQLIDGEHHGHGDGQTEPRLATQPRSRC